MKQCKYKNCKNLAMWGDVCEYHQKQEWEVIKNRIVGTIILILLVFMGICSIANRNVTDNNKEHAEENNITELDSNDTEVSFDYDNYLCPWFDQVYLNEENYNLLVAQWGGTTFPEGRTLNQMIINELYARHGYLYENSSLNDYFMEKSWYCNMNGKVNDKETITAKLSEVEQYNLKFITSLRDLESQLNQ